MVRVHAAEPADATLRLPSLCLRGRIDFMFFVPCIVWGLSYVFVQTVVDQLKVEILQFTDPFVMIEYVACLVDWIVMIASHTLNEHQQDNKACFYFAGCVLDNHYLDFWVSNNLPAGSCSWW